MKTKYTMNNQQLRKYYLYAGDMVIRFSRSCDYQDNDKGCEYNGIYLVYGNWYHEKTGNWYCKTHAIKMIESGQVQKAVR